MSEGTLKMNDFGKILVFLGLVLAGLGLILLYGPQIPWLGKLPGDITIKREHFTFYFPLASSIVISILLTILFSLFRR
jgi:thiosulfate reductase cytochrome b subunit